MAFRIQEDISLSSFTTFKTGGCAKYLAQVTTIDELRTALVFAEQKQVPYFVLGSGSNVLGPDSGYAGLIILMQLKGREYHDESEAVVFATFAAGELFDDVIAETVDLGMWGLENLSHIPGTVGATPVQNVGAYGVEVSSLITGLSVFNCQENKIELYTNQHCQFAYRDSCFKRSNQSHLIILGVTFKLSKVAAPQLEYADLAVLRSNTAVALSVVRTTIIAIRSTKFPDWQHVGTAGSFFKNPIISSADSEALVKNFPQLPVYIIDESTVKVSLGFILDKICGLKGCRRGKIHLSEVQALVLIADTGATTTDIILFSKFITDEVKIKTGIDIEQEVTLLM